MSSIGPSTVIRGDVTCDEDLVIQGHVMGHVLVRAHTVVIAQEARLAADVRAAVVRVRGEVKGNISATDRIELAATAIVSGSLSANHVVMHDGARFNGRIDMDQRTIAMKLAQYRRA